MSRTYRRKNDTQSYNNYEDAEEFNHIKAVYDAGNPKPEPVRTPCGKYWDYRSNEWRDYYSARYFLKYSYGKTTYEAWRAKETAWFHSDCGWGRHKYQTAPGWFVTQFCQRPFRSRCKQMMREALIHDSWDGMALPPHIRDAAWKYD